MGVGALVIETPLDRIATGSFIFLGVSVAVFGVVRAAGAVIAPLVILSVALLAVRFPLAELLLERYRADAIWWSFPVSSDRKSTRLNSSHLGISYAVFCLKKKKKYTVRIVNKLITSRIRV